MEQTLFVLVLQTLVHPEAVCVERTLFVLVLLILVPLEVAFAVSMWLVLELLTRVFRVHVCVEPLPITYTPPVQDLLTPAHQEAVCVERILFVLLLQILVHLVFAFVELTQSAPEILTRARPVRACAEQMTPVLEQVTDAFLVSVCADQKKHAKECDVLVGSANVSYNFSCSMTKYSFCNVMNLVYINIILCL